MSGSKPPTKQMRYNLRSLSRTNAVVASPEPKRKRPTSNIHELMDLNDHCLLKIFEFLDPNLVDVVRVNKRLYSLVNYYMNFKYNLQFNENFEFATENGSPVSLDVARTFLSVFGHKMKILKLSSGSFILPSPRTDIGLILPMIQQFCNLQELTIKDFGMCGLLQSFFTQLDSLTLDNCSVSREWCKMKQLKTLKLIHFIVRRWPMEYCSREAYYEFGLKPGPIKIPVANFGGLKELQISDTNLENPAVVQLIELNPSLEKLSVTKNVAVSTFVFTAVQRLKNLVEFEFKKPLRKNSQSNTAYHMVSLFSLKKLKTLKLFHNIPTKQLMEGFVKNGIALEHLELGGNNFDDQSAESIVKMSSIKVLKLNDMFGLNEEQLLIIVKGLEGLEELHVKTEANVTQAALLGIVREAHHLHQLKIDGLITPLDVETYQSMITAIQNRIERIGLRIIVFGSGENSFTQNVVLDEGNEEWLSIEELDRTSNHLFEVLESKVSLNPPVSRYYDSDSDSDSDYDD
ncbi:uncharacterized protein LOC119076528 [Bradysia coprophila]|uniref:uncharacterized protein LOC119076528 n=1 Tax=Bradysia coprophila TaxID=38358 RepID=UPI00187DC491|nr:uncharacterized protein LOC119076528 [Bradysia coprophila]XP_037039220.1 uncharacterized protein LOC119076528 [Bradysia coprophila]